MTTRSGCVVERRTLPCRDAKSVEQMPHALGLLVVFVRRGFAVVVDDDD